MSEQRNKYDSDDSPFICKNCGMRALWVPLGEEMQLQVLCVYCGGKLFHIEGVKIDLSKWVMTYGTNG